MEQEIKTLKQELAILEGEHNATDVLRSTLPVLFRLPRYLCTNSTLLALPHSQLITSNPRTFFPSEHYLYVHDMRAYQCSTLASRHYRACLPRLLCATVPHRLLLDGVHLRAEAIAVRLITMLMYRAPAGTTRARTIKYLP